MKKHTYDLLWSIMASYGAFSAVRVKRRKNIPLLLTLQEGDSFEYIYNKVRFVRGSFDAIFKNADGIQAISNYLLNWGRELGYQGAYGLVIPNGVAVEAFTQNFTKEQIATKRLSFCFSSNALILFTSSRLEIKNGVGDVINALSLMPENVCFVICGSGSLELELQAQVGRLGLERRVKFMGFVDPKELPLLMKASDIFIRPSLSEGLGNAFLEAMAVGIITVGTNAGGIPDFLKDGETGFIVGIQNPQSIADIISNITVLSESKKEAILVRAKKLVLEKYNWDIVTKSMERLFNNLFSNS